MYEHECERAYEREQNVQMNVREEKWSPVMMPRTYFLVYRNTGNGVLRAQAIARVSACRTEKGQLRRSNCPPLKRDDAYFKSGSTCFS